MRQEEPWSKILLMRVTPGIVVGLSIYLKDYAEAATVFVIILFLHLGELGARRLERVMTPEDQPTLREVPTGWHIVGSGSARSGDKYWRPHDRVWLPVIPWTMKDGINVRLPDMPVIIRKGKR